MATDGPCQLWHAIRPWAVAIRGVYGSKGAHGYSWVFPESYLSQSGVNGENRETRHAMQKLSPYESEYPSVEMAYLEP